MKLRFILWMQLLMLPLIVFSSFSGCEADDENKSEPSKDHVSVLPEGELVLDCTESIDTLIINSSGTWQVLTSELPEWITVEPVSGEDGDIVVVTTSANNSTSMRNTVLTVQCGIANTQVAITQYDHVETNYINLRFGEPGVSVSYTSSGSLSVHYDDGDIPTVSDFQAIVLPVEYNHDIRVIESHSIQGKKLNMQTSQGDMNDLFRNARFTLSTNPSASTRTADGTPVYTPVSCGTMDAQGRYIELYNYESPSRTIYQNGDELWSFHTDFDGDNILSGPAGRLYWERLSYDASLHGEFLFDFGEKQINQVRRKGDIRLFRYQLTGNVKADMKLHYQYNYAYEEKSDKIIKKNAIPRRSFKFIVGNVPVYLNVDTHLGCYTRFEVDGSVNASTGVCANNEMNIGLEWTPDGGFSTIGPDATPTLNVYPPTFESHASVMGKVSYYPHIEIELYRFFGPWIEPRSYIKSSVEAGLQVSTDENNYIGWKSQNHNGLDLRLGLGLNVFGLEHELYDSPLLNPVKDQLLFDAPSHIRCLSPKDGTEVKSGEKVIAEFIVESFSPVTNQYYPCPFALVNFEAECGELNSKVMVANAEGKASVEWTPLPNEETRASDMVNRILTARIVDKEGKAIKTASLTIKTERINLCPDDNHPHAIDLGLPSGTKWACCNVGASSPEGYGGYYAWGETEEKSDYDWDTYKWCKGSINSMTKYCISDNYDIVDNKTILDLEDDVVHVKWGANWCMPTLDDGGELVNNCTWKWTTYNSVNGLLVIGPNGNSLFLPAAGVRNGTKLYECGSDAVYWSATLALSEEYEKLLIEDYSHLVYAFTFDINFDDWFYVGNSYGFRCYGFPIRPVTK